MAPSMLPWCSRKNGRITLVRKRCDEEIASSKILKEVSLGVDHISAVSLNWSHAPDKEKAFGEPVERHLEELVEDNFRHKTIQNQPSQRWSLRSTRRQRRLRRPPSKWATACRRSSPCSPAPWSSSTRGRRSPQCWPAAKEVRDNVGQKYLVKTNLRPKPESQPEDNDTAETISDVEPLHSGVVFQHLERVSNLMS